MKIVVKIIGEACWFLHKWETKKDTGFTKYFECKKCHARKVTQPEGAGYQPVDYDWLCRKMEEIEDTKPDRYPMCKDQPAQIDCRVIECKKHGKGACHNISPALTLNPDKSYVCWSMEVEPTLPIKGE